MNESSCPAGETPWLDKYPELGHGCFFSRQLPPSDSPPTTASDADSLSTQRNMTWRRVIPASPRLLPPKSQNPETTAPTPVLSSSPPLEQLARRLREQSLAAKAKSECSPPSLFLQRTPSAALEIDPEEDCGDDACDSAMYRHYYEGLLGAQVPQAPSHDRLNDPTTADIRAKLNADIAKRFNGSRYGMGPVMADHKSPIEADPLLADEGFDEPMLNETSSLRSSMADGVRRRRELGFRTSAEAASSCRLVVCKAPRMRRRTKVTSKKTKTLPIEGAKGAEAAAQICDLS